MGNTCCTRCRSACLNNSGEDDDGTADTVCKSAVTSRRRKPSSSSSPNVMRHQSTPPEDLGSFAADAPNEQLPDIEQLRTALASHSFNNQPRYRNVLNERQQQQTGYEAVRHNPLDAPSAARVAPQATADFPVSDSSAQLREIAMQALAQKMLFEAKKMSAHRPMGGAPPQASSSHPANVPHIFGHGVVLPVVPHECSGDEVEVETEHAGDEFSLASASTQHSFVSSQLVMVSSRQLDGEIPTVSDHRGYAKLDGKSRRVSAAPPSAVQPSETLQSGEGVDEHAPPSECSLLGRSFDAGAMHIGGQLTEVPLGEGDESSFMPASVNNSFDQYLIEHMLRCQRQNAHNLWFQTTVVSKESLNRRNRCNTIVFDQTVVVEKSSPDDPSCTPVPWDGDGTSTLVPSVQTTLSVDGCGPASGPVPADSGMSMSGSSQGPRRDEREGHAQPLSGSSRRRRSRGELSMLIDSSTPHERQLARRCHAPDLLQMYHL